MVPNINNIWKTYELNEDSKINFRSIDFEIDSESMELLSTQVFEFNGKLYLSVLWKRE